MAILSNIPQYSFNFVNALSIVAEWHRYQQRRTGEPYIAHLLATAVLVLENGGTETEAIAALAHDAIEDAGKTPKEIDLHFGKEVAQIVIALTEDKTNYKEKCKRDYAARIAISDRSVAFVSAADKLHNLRSYTKNPELITPDTVWFYCLLFPRYCDVLGEGCSILREMYWLIRQIIKCYDAYILPGLTGVDRDRLLISPTEISSGMRVATSLDFVRTVSPFQKKELERNEMPGVELRLADGDHTLRKLSC